MFVQGTGFYQKKEISQIWQVFSGKNWIAIVFAPNSVILTWGADGGNRANTLRQISARIRLLQGAGNWYPTISIEKSARSAWFNVSLAAFVAGGSSWQVKIRLVFAGTQSGFELASAHLVGSRPA